MIAAIKDITKKQGELDGNRFYFSKPSGICFRQGRGPKSANLCYIKLFSIYTRSGNTEHWQEKRKYDLGHGHESLQKHLGKQEIRSDQKLNSQRTH